MNTNSSEILLSVHPASAQSRPLALVGGRLIDGFGGPPLANSVILIEGERITADRQVGTLAVPADAEMISTEGMTVLPGLWECHVHTMLFGHSDYEHWDKTYPPRIRQRNHAGGRETTAHGRRHQRARSRRPAQGQH